MDCDDDFRAVYQLGRQIVKTSFQLATRDCDFSQFNMPIAVDDYQSVDSQTFETMHE